MANLFHEDNCSLNSVIVDEGKSVSLGEDAKQHIENLKDDGLKDKLSSEKLSNKLDVSKEAGSELEFVFLILAKKQEFSILCEKLIEAVLAVLEEGATENAALRVLLGQP